MHNRGELFHHLERQLDLPRPQLEQAAEAVLHALHERLGPEADHLGAQLPEDVKPMFLPPPAPQQPTGAHAPHKLHLADFVAHVADDGGIGRREAELLTAAVFHELKAHITEGESRHVAAVLPGDIKEVWERA